MQGGGVRRGIAAAVTLVVALGLAGAAGADPLGEITEFPQGPLVAPVDITTGPDGNLWFTRDAFEGLTRITPAGETTEFTGLTDNADGITTGPDGNLWFTEFNAVGRMTTDGTLTEFPVPGMSGRGIITGPDGNMWFAQFNQGEIGRMDPLAADPGATLTEFAVGSNPYSLTIGSDGNIWFTELFGGGALGRMTTAGVYTQFPLPIADRTPLGITTGSDGLLYFTERDFGIVGRIDPNAADPMSTYEEFPVPDSPPLQSITTGPDGAVWFSIQEPPGFGRLTPAGEMTVYPLSFTETESRGITAGPDCNIWQVAGFEEQEAFVARIGTGLEPPDCTAPVTPEPIVLEPTFTG